MLKPPTADRRLSAGIRRPGGKIGEIQYNACCSSTAAFPVPFGKGTVCQKIRRDLRYVDRDLRYVKKFAPRFIAYSCKIQDHNDGRAPSSCATSITRAPIIVVFDEPPRIKMSSLATATPAFPCHPSDGRFFRLRDRNQPDLYARFILRL